MRVVHERAGAACHEFINEGLARTYRRLGQTGYPVHAVGQALAVPVDTRVFGQLVGHENAHAIALDHFDRRSGRLPVVAPEIGLEARRHLPHDRLSHQVKLLHVVVHSPGQGPAIEGDHGVVGPTARRRQRSHGVGCRLKHGLGQCGHRDLAHAGSGQGAGDGTGAAQKIASVCHVVRFVGGALPRLSGLHQRRRVRHPNC